jgi:hypothetical protein
MPEAQCLMFEPVDSKGGAAMKLSLCLVLCLVFGAAVSAGAVEKGTIETGGGADLHLSPSPWYLDAQMHLIYYINPMLGIGPYWSVAMQGDYEDVSYPTLYGIGALGKLYLPMAYMDGRMTPFVMAGFGIMSMPIMSTDVDKAYDTESKSKFMMRVGFDYWLTDKWTVWVGYQGDKVFVEESDWDSSVKLGISTFLMP